MKKTYEEVLQESTKYFNGDDLAAKVFADKYALRNKEGEYLESTPDQMHRRLAKEFARIEAKYDNGMSEDEVYNLIKDFKYIVPQGSPMSAVGNTHKVQSTSNCFVVESPHDSYAGILKTDQEIAQIGKRRGGIGFDISTLRPRGMVIENAAGHSDGIEIFMERFSNTCREVAQSGRRGALLLSISCHHPDIKTFITIKRDLEKVTGANISVRWSDEFLEAVEKNEEVQLRWPVDERENPEVSVMESAKDIWDQFCESAHKSAEPGCLFWDKALEMTPSDIYADQGYRSVSTNPCLAGDTLVAVADGRGPLPIKQLADEGKDVPVFCSDEKGKVIVRTMRNPRVTGFNEEVLKVTVEGGHSFKATPNHKMMVNGEGFVRVDELKVGDSLQLTMRKEASIQEGFANGNKNTQKYFWWKSPNRKVPKSEHRLIWESVHGEVPKHHVIHHIDYNAKNNALGNLQCMTKKAHDELHAQDMIGEKNPYHKMPDEWKKDFATHEGEENGRYSGFTHEEIRLHAIKLTKKLGIRFSNGAWTEYAKEHGLPQSFTSFRSDVLGNPTELGIWAAQECGLEFSNADPRLMKTLTEMEDQGYQARIEGSEVLVKRKCEACQSTFEIEHNRREQGFCSIKCSTAYVNSDRKIAQRRIEGRNRQEAERQKLQKEKQLQAYTSAKFKLGRIPKMTEWEAECKEMGVPYRVGKTLKHGFKTYSEVKAAGNEYNHRIVSIEPAGKEDVYNGTVDEVHNFLMGAFEEVGESGDQKLLFFSNLNCGEIVLSSGDSCRLLLLNTFSHVDQPFTPQATFNFEKFTENAIKAQRLMDDLVDLELEAVDRIIAKVKSDPEPENVKATELHLWEGVKRAATEGRRTGLGVNAIGDTLAALGMVYGSPESIEMTGEIYKALALAAYRSSCLLAKERGAFQHYDFAKEEGHPFMERIFEADPELRELHKKYGRRNIALTTTAPSGSASMMTQTTSGIEPVFMLEYMRRKKINPNDQEARVDFTDDLGDKWQQFIVRHHGFQKWMDVSGKTEVKDSPYAGATANEIDWVASVDIQAAAQKWVCHAISKTINLPSDVSVEKVHEVYWHSWKQGLKGVTVYRDGSRSGVLVAADDKGGKDVDENGRPLKIVHTQSPGRPGNLECEIYQSKSNGTPWTVLIGVLDGEPYEVFMGNSSTLSLPKKCTKGMIKKVSKGKYDLHVAIGDDDELVVKDIIKTFDNPESAWATRMVSVALRHGTPPEFLVTQLSKDGGITDVNKILSRVLKRFLKDGEKVKGNVKCPDCGGDNLVYIEGCQTCQDCGNSKCG